MKKLTNKHGLPQPLYSAVANDSYSKGDSDVSITGLLQPPRISALAEKHKDEIEEDAMDRIWSLLGQSIHTILERSDDGSEMSEERITVEIDGVKVSGQFDRFVVSSGIIQDYKVTTAYKFKTPFGGGKLEAPADYQRQLNCYAYLLRSQGYEVKGAEIVAILRDWSKGQAQRDDTFPQKQVVVVPVEIRSLEDTRAFLKRRVAAWKAAKENLPQCSDEDRWAKAPKHAVMKTGRKRAVRLYDSRNEASARVDKEGAGHYIEFRPGENIRCESYCAVKSWCSQFKDLKNKNKETK